MQKFVSLVSLAAVVLVGFTGNVLAAKQVEKTVSIPAQFAATIQATNCAGSPGPEVSVQSELIPVGLKAEIILSQPGRQLTPGERIVAEQEVIPQNAALPLPAQSIVAPLGNDPFMWLQLTDAMGRSLTSEIFLGRCSQGSFNPTATLVVPVDSHVELSSSACDSPTPAVTVADGSADITPVNGKLILRNTSDPRGGPVQTGEVKVDLALLPAGQTFPFSQETVQGAISDPHISLQLREGGGEPLGNEVRVGRCVALTN